MTVKVERAAVADSDSSASSSTGMTRAATTEAIARPPIPRNFLEYLKSFGPGLVVALTWLGASDLVSSALAGAEYGYALM